MFINDQEQRLTDVPVFKFRLMKPVMVFAFFVAKERRGEEAVRIQCCFTSTETIRTIRDGSPRRPPPLPHSS